MRQTPKQFKKHYDDFFMWVGHCIKRWAHLEHVLFGICEFCLATDKRFVSVIFYRTPNLDARISLTADLLEAKFIPVTLKSGEHPPAVIKEWRNIQQRMRELVEFRNFLAHQPLTVWGGTFVAALPKKNKDGTTRKNSRAKVISSGASQLKIVLDAAEALRGRKKNIAEIQLEDMKRHYKLLDELIKSLWTFSTDLRLLQPTQRAPKS